MNILKKLRLPFILLITVALASCSSTSKKNTSKDGSSASATNEGITFELNTDSDSNSAGTFKTVYFDFDSSKLTDSTRSDLEHNANLLKQYSTVEVQIEGHCDERGGVQYNLALGERRASAILNYLSALGVSKSRVSIISFGKERPLTYGHDESSWSQNRRGNFVVTAK